MNNPLILFYFIINEFNLLLLIKKKFHFNNCDSIKNTMSIKKQSLFKQKLKQTNNKIIQSTNKQSTTNDNINQIQSFPKVFKINQYNIDKTDKSLIIDKTQQPMINQIEQQSKKLLKQSYLENHHSQLTGILSHDQINQINNQNWNAVNSMTSQERDNYINLIQHTLPKQFIKKLKKYQSQPSTSLLNQTPKIQKMIPEIQNMSLSSSLNSIPAHKTSDPQAVLDKQNQTNDENEDHKTIMDQIYLNIKTGKLVYLPENVLVTFSEDQKSQLLNKTKIFQMLTTENNQSQIIGSQLTLMWLKNIFPSSNLVFYVDNIPFHIRIMVSEMYGLLKVIQSNLKSTKFYSCYIEMLVKSVQILTIVYKNLSFSQLKQQVLVIQNEFQKTQKSLKELLNSKNDMQSQQRNLRQQKEMLFQSLGILNQSLKQQQSSKEQSQKIAFSQIEIEQQFEKLQSNNKLNDLVEVILIEQTLKKEEFQKYEIYPSINNFLQTISQFWDCKIGPGLSNPLKILSSMKKFYNILYQLVCKFVKKQKSLPFYRNLVKNIYLGILQVIQEPYLKKVFELLSYNEKKKVQIELSNQIFFQILFIYRQLSYDSGKFVCFLEKEKEKFFITEDQTSILVYLNFDHYVSVSDLRNDEIKIVENMLHWLKKRMQNNEDQIKRTFLDSDEVLTTLLKLFLSSEQEVYSLLDQNLLHEIFKEAIRFYESKKEKLFPILSENEIKKMVQNYNFNSFGNDIFTKVIFWVAVSINPQTEALIGQEVMMRYPMLFYYACEPIKVTQNLNSQQHILEEKIQSPLLGNFTHYINTKLDSQKCGFSVSSNELTKENLLKLLSLNLDFGHSDFLKQQQIRMILSSQQKGQTQGFNITKQKVDNKNYFIRYLIQPFIRK